MAVTALPNRTSLEPERKKAQGATDAPQPAAAHAMAVEELLQTLRTDPEQGLADAEAQSRLAQFGTNELYQAPPTPRWKRFLHQFKQLVIQILIGAAILSAMVGEWVDSMAILAIVILNGIIGFFQEEKAGQSIAALRDLSAPEAKVRRNGSVQRLAAAELVPGDRVELEAGDRVPADVRLIRSHGFRVQEAALTGESVPVDKDAAAMVPHDAPLGDRPTMAYAGTVATAGKASAVVTATGMETELGNIAEMLTHGRRQQTPLQRRLDELGKVLVVVCLIAVAVVFSLQLYRGADLAQAFVLSISLAVAAVPEGLPTVVTIALALGLQRMVRRNALIRSLPSVETLGSVTVICSDKTGTLTRNEMTVRELVTADCLVEVSGTGYTSHGRFHRKDAGGSSTLLDASNDPDLTMAATIGARCTSAHLTPDQRNPGSFHVIGDPTEGALLILARKVNLNGGEHKVISELPFDSQRKAMSVVVAEKPGEATMYTKGAPEVILGKCRAVRIRGEERPLDEATKTSLLSQAEAMAERALRVLALAYREGLDPNSAQHNEHDLTFCALVGMIDPPRDEAREAVRLCRKAGIRVIMITGDHPGTARAVGQELGIIGADGAVLSGAELDRLEEERLRETTQETSVYARVSSEHKLRLIEGLRANGQIVAMTGDGVNDAPAVKAADIGIAMGITGTDVTKEASDMVLTDDNFASIVGAVEEGRGIFDNIQHFIHYLLSCNASEVMLMLFAAAIGWHAPLTAVQLLWINLVTDGLPALSLAFEPPSSDIMARRPRPPKEPVITREKGALILRHGIVLMIISASAFALFSQDGELELARTATFGVTAFAQLFFVLACRSDRHTAPELGPQSNPYLFAAIAASGFLQLLIMQLPFMRGIFGTVALSLTEWALIILLALIPVSIVEIAKLVWRFARRRIRPTGDA